MTDTNETRQTIRVVALQPALRWLQPLPNMSALRQTCEQLVREHKPDLIVLPESFNGQPCDYDNGAAGRQARQFLGTLARACRVPVIGGSVEYQYDDGVRRNTCFVVDAEGNEIGRYDKRVLFNREQDDRQRGMSPGVFDIGGVRVGVLICADLWDPVITRETAAQCDVLCVPAKTTVPTENNIEYAREMWWNLAMTRAVENAVPVVVSDWAGGRHDTKRIVDGTVVRDVSYTSGGASIVDPGRRPDFDRMQQKIVRGAPGELVATIDLAATATFRDYRCAVGLLPKRRES